MRLQAIFRGRQVRKQAAITLRCMQALVRVQARFRSQSIQSSLDGDSKKMSVSDDDPFKQAEVTNHICILCMHVCNIIYYMGRVLFIITN